MVAAQATLSLPEHAPGFDTSCDCWARIEGLTLRMKRSTSLRRKMPRRNRLEGITPMVVSILVSRSREASVKALLQELQDVQGTDSVPTKDISQDVHVILAWHFASDVSCCFEQERSQQ